MKTQCLAAVSIDQPVQRPEKRGTEYERGCHLKELSVSLRNMDSTDRLSVRKVGWRDLASLGLLSHPLVLGSPRGTRR